MQAERAETMDKNEENKTVTGNNESLKNSAENNAELVNAELQVNAELVNAELQVNTEQQGGEQGYWRSFKELHNDPSFGKALRNEFGEESLTKPDVKSMSAVTRRRFIALMSAGAAVAAAGCENYHEKGLIVPYNRKPEEITLGLPNYYASTCGGCESACGILIKTREGRPIKIDGNPDHPVNKGKLCAKGQAAIMSLYHPERLREPFSGKSQSTWEAVNKSITEALASAKASGKEIAFVTGKIVSPTFKKALDEFTAAYPSAKIYSYEVFNDSARKSAWMKSFGKPVMPVLQLDKAKVIVALESDFLGTEQNMLEYTRLYMQNRDVMNGREFNRLYALEGAATITGMNADYRLRLRTDAMEELVMCLLNEFVNRKKISGFTADSGVNRLFASNNLEQFTKKYSLNEEYIKNLVNDLEKHRGDAIVIAGDKMPESTHTAVNLLNEVLGGNKLYSGGEENIDVIPLSEQSDIEALISGLNSGNTAVLIHIDTNPVYTFSPELGYAEAMKKAGITVTMTEQVSETSEASGIVLPLNNQLESWGDYKTRTGFYSLQQPVIAPLYNTRQKEAVILNWLKPAEFTEKLYLDYLTDNWEKNFYPVTGAAAPFKKFWNSALHDGVVLVNEKPDTATAAFSADAFTASKPMKPSDDFVILLQGNNNVGDGRFASNGWLQELPNTITKIVWDNYAAISVQSAAELGVNNDDMLEVTIGGRKQSFPVFIQPGLADKVIEVSLGYGRKSAGVIGTGIGVDAYRLSAKKPGLSERLYNDAKVSKSDGTYELISTQEHFPIESDPLLKDIQFRRGIIREGTYKEYKKNPSFLKKESHLNMKPIVTPPVYDREGFTGYKWGMAIDLNKCTGCGACVTACNVENNIPIVGKDQVKANREMMWLRIDRYYYGSPDSPGANFQPMLCQHCDYAPCENVCPVAATTHSSDGLNGMTYNRCVGTRYCSNNCPYKVRRFNYFDWRDRLGDGIQYAEPLDLMANPEVTVRSRGVMEKCTFCLQRIMKERQDAIQENRTVIGSNVKTACQEACPAYAIEFGNVNDKESVIAKYREHELGYSVLEEIKVLPNVTYVAKLRNTEEPVHKEEQGH